jgi:hypothetical protein
VTDARRVYSGAVVSSILVSLEVVFPTGTFYENFCLIFKRKSLPVLVPVLLTVTGYYPFCTLSFYGLVTAFTTSHYTIFVEN